MSSVKYYLEYKKCKECGSEFCARSEHGNPYRHCPLCRQAKWQKLLNFVKQGAKKKK